MHRCWLARILVCVVGAVASILAGTASPGADPRKPGLNGAGRLGMASSGERRGRRAWRKSTSSWLGMSTWSRLSRTDCGGRSCLRGGDQGPEAGDRPGAGPRDRPRALGGGVAGGHVSAVHGQTQRRLDSFHTRVRWPVVYVAGMRDVLVCLDAGRVRSGGGSISSNSSSRPCRRSASSARPWSWVTMCLSRRPRASASWKADRPSRVADFGRRRRDVRQCLLLAGLGHGLRPGTTARPDTPKLAGVGSGVRPNLWSQDIPAMLGMKSSRRRCGATPSSPAPTAGAANVGDQASSGWFPAATVWKTALQGYMSTPVVIDRYAYLHLRSQRFTCIDLTTGEQKWTTQPYGQY